MAIEIYLHSPDIHGIHSVDSESTYAATENKLVRLESIQHSMSLPVSDLRPSVLGGLPRLGHPEHNLLIASRKLDPSTIELMKAHVAGKLLKLVQVFGCRLVEEADTRVPRPIFQILMSNVVISDYSYAMSADAASETLQFRYSSIGWRIRPVKRGTDEPQAWAECWWDGVKNKPEIDSPGIAAPGPAGAETNPEKVFKDAGFK